MLLVLKFVVAVSAPLLQLRPMVWGDAAWSAVELLLVEGQFRFVVAAQYDRACESIGADNDGPAIARRRGAGKIHVRIWKKSRIEIVGRIDSVVIIRQGNSARVGSVRNISQYYFVSR